MRTESPSPFPPLTFFGTASSVVPDFVSHQTLVSQETPSTVARTGVRPQPWVGGGACFFGTRAKCQPPCPGNLRSLAVKVATARAYSGRPRSERAESASPSSTRVPVPSSLRTAQPEA